MYYFVGINIPSVITGVERAMFNRLELFKQNDIPAKILLTDYLPYLYHHTKTYGIEDDTIYMYDYFQDAMHYKTTTHVDWIAYWEYTKGYTKSRIGESNDFAFYKDGQLKLYARFLDSTHIVLQYINYYDSNNKIIKRDMFDYRGFLSCSHFFHQSGKEFLQTIYDIHGNVVIQRFFDTNTTSHKLTKILLKEKNGMFESFNSEASFIAYFIECIYKKGDHFIIDRPMEIVPAFTKVSSDIPASAFIHTTLYANMYRTDNKNVAFIYHALFQNLNRFDSLIVSTQAQREDIESLVQNDIKVYNIPVGFVKSSTSRNTQIHKNPFQLISIARFVVGKQIDHQIRLIHKLKDEFPEIKLNCYGYGGERQNLQALIDSLNINNHVTLHDFQTNIEAIYKHAGLTLFTSSVEGFALSIIESLQQGTPVISYDIKYGPNEMIVDGFNGNLVPMNDEDALYECVRNFLLNTHLQQTYYNNCLPSIQPFEASHISSQWMKFINEHK